MRSTVQHTAGMELSIVAVGAVAGVAVATPFGPISLLLLETGRRLGPRRGFPAALGVALTDLVYAAVAGLGGARARSMIDGHERVVSVGSGLVLIAVAAWCTVRALGSRGPEPTAEVSPRSPGRLLTGFIGLTLVNPLTIVAFLAVTTGIRVEFTAVTVPVFALVVFAVSLVWHTGLVGGGAVLGRVLSPSVQRLTAMVGGLAIASLGIRSLVG